MTAQVSNLALVGSAARLSRALSLAGSARQQVDNIEGSEAPPTRDNTAQNTASYDRYDAPAARKRFGSSLDQVVSFGGVLVSSEVGATIVQTQAQSQSGALPLDPGEAERQIANYEFAQSLVGPAEVMEAYHQ